MPKTSYISVWTRASSTKSSSICYTMSTRPQICYIHTRTTELENYFQLEEKDSAECKTEFCFDKNDIPFLAEALQVPEVFKCHQGTVCDGTEGLCILLKRFEYFCRYSDMVSCFARPDPEIAMISNRMVDFIYEQHSHRITRMEWNRAEPRPVRNLRRRRVRKRSSSRELFWLYWRNRPPHLPTRKRPTNRIQWPQETTWIGVPISGQSQWTYCPSLWTCW